jgi:hypothetical protein
MSQVIEDQIAAGSDDGGDIDEVDPGAFVAVVAIDVD